MTLSYGTWLTSIEEERVKQAEGGMLVEVIKAHQEGLQVKLELEVMPDSAYAHIDELIEEPSDFLAHDKTFEWCADVLAVERPTKRGPLSLWLAVTLPKEGVELNVGDELFLSPPDFLAGLQKRIHTRLESSPKLADRALKAEVEALYKRSTRAASASSLSEALSRLPAYQHPPSFREAQRGAMVASELPLSFVWGPPGTGKTFTLGHIVAQLVSKPTPERVLVLSIANLAVERTLLSADDAYQALKGEPAPEALLLRTQVPTLEEVKARHHLTAWSRLKAEHSATLLRLKSELRELQGKLRGSVGSARELLLERVAKVKRRQAGAKAEYREERQHLIKDAGAIMSTLTQFAWADDLYGSDFDVVILEEASMIPALYSMELFERFPKARFIIAGDPYQLSPVSELKEPSEPAWFESTFDLFGVKSLSEATLGSSERCSAINFLNIQGRMPQAIGDAVSSAFYQGRLRTAPQQRERTPVEGWPSSPLVWIDQSEARQLAERSGISPQERSGNLCHEQARAALKLAQEAEEAGLSVHIITPFVNQERLLQSYARQLRLKTPCTTIHKAQGSEAEVIIFSTVKPGGWFMRESDLARELNVVATSRAQHTLVILGELRDARQNPHLKPFIDGAERWYTA